MKAIFMMRGWKNAQDEVIKHLETSVREMPVWKNEADYKAGKKPTMIPCPCSLRPWRIMEFVFPEFGKDAVLTTLGFHQEKDYLSIKQKAQIEIMRKMMSLEKPPKFKTDKVMMNMTSAMKDVSIIPIGIKEDPFRVLHDDGLFHEAI